MLRCLWKMAGKSSRRSQFHLGEMELWFERIFLDVRISPKAMALRGLSIHSSPYLQFFMVWVCEVVIFTISDILAFLLLNLRVL